MPLWDQEDAFRERLKKRGNFFAKCALTRYTLVPLPQQGKTTVKNRALCSAGLDPTVYDKRLVETREGVNETIREVLTFRFRTEAEEAAAQASLENSTRWVGKESVFAAWRA